MDKQPVVVLLGDSLLIDAVAASLGQRQVPGMVRMDACAVDVVERLRSLRPDLILFELDTPQSQSLLSLLRELPGVRLVGLDLACNQVLVLDSCQHTAHTMDDLAQVIQANASRSLACREEVD